MARLPRVVIVDVPHHVTQRGNARQVILKSDADRVTYLELLREYSQIYALSLLGYCLMSNHVHLIAIPQTSQVGKPGTGGTFPSFRLCHRQPNNWGTSRLSPGFKPLLLAFIIFNMTALSWADLTYVLPATSLGYVLVALIARFGLHEHITPLRWVGIALIAGGVGFVAGGPALTHHEEPVPAAVAAAASSGAKS
jgi:hypothetical protein